MENDKPIKTKGLKILILVGFIVIFAIGISIGKGIGKVKIQEITKEVPKEVVKEVPIEKCTREEQWKALKEIDDQALMGATEALTISQNIFVAFSNFDVAKANEEAKKFTPLAKKIQGFAEKRAEILSKLGY